VGIAEQHAVTLSAGMAKDGLIPFCNIYSSFMQRAYDQVIHDVALPQLPVIFCLDRAGIVGADGATHHGVFDLAFMRAIPNIVLASPVDEIELQHLMYTAYLSKKPFVIRYPRGNGEHLVWKVPFKELPIGKGICMAEGRDVAIVSIGPLGNRAYEAIERVKQTHNVQLAWYNMRFVKPLDEQLLQEVFESFPTVITLEDGVTQGGFGSAVLEYASKINYKGSIHRLGIPDAFIPHGTQEELYTFCKIDTENLYEFFVSLLT